MKKILLYIVICLFCCACSQSSKPKKKELLIYSGAGLTNVITDLVKTYQESNDIDIQLNFASSGTLARQIEHGAQPAIYISANEKWVDYLTDLDKLVKDSKQKIAGNSLAVIAPSSSHIDSILFENSLPEQFVGRLAIGDPKHVPAGDYAWQAIVNAGYEETLKERILPAKDVRSALMVVELGEVEIGMVYKTDALKSEKVKIIAEVPETLYSPIGFYASILKGKDDEQNRLFYSFLTSNGAKAIWKNHGFIVE